MVVKECKGFTLISLENRVIVQTPLQSFVLRGINNNTTQIAHIQEIITEQSSLSDLVGLFYYRDELGCNTKKLIEMVVIGGRYGD